MVSSGVVRTCVVGCVAWLGAVGVAPAAVVDVYLLAGQSNMDGRGPVARLVGPLAGYAQTRDDILLDYNNSTLRDDPAISSGGWVPLRPGYAVGPQTPPRPATTTRVDATAPAATGPAALGPAATTRPAATAPATRPARWRPGVPGPAFGPEIGFGFAAADELPPGHRLALIKFSVGGTDLHRQWNPQTRGLLYDQCVAFTRQALADLAARGDTPVLRGVLWHQGESDASLPADVYQGLLTDLITSFRRDLGNADLPVAVGEVYDNGRRDTVRAAERAAAREVPDVYFVSSANLMTQDNGTHFDAPSQLELGRRFAVALRTKADVVPATRPATRPATLPATDPPEPTP